MFKRLRLCLNRFGAILLACFCWCLSIFCEIRIIKPTQAPKKQNNKHVEQLLRRGSKVPSKFGYFIFFGACVGLVHLLVCLFVFVFLVPVNVLYISWQDHDEKHEPYQGFRPSKCIKHRKFQCVMLLSF